MKIIWCMIPEIGSATDRIFSRFGPFFAPFTRPRPLTTQRTKILKKWKKQLDISSFYTSVPKMTIIWYMVPGIWRFWTDRIFLSSWAIFLPFFPLRARKMKISKNEKNTWGYHNFTQLYQNSWSNAILFLRYGAWRM